MAHGAALRDAAQTLLFVVLAGKAETIALKQSAAARVPSNSTAAPPRASWPHCRARASSPSRRKTQGRGCLWHRPDDATHSCPRQRDRQTSLLVDAKHVEHVRGHGLAHARRGGASCGTCKAAGLPSIGTRRKLAQQGQSEIAPHAVPCDCQISLSERKCGRPRPRSWGG